MKADWQTLLLSELAMHLERHGFVRVARRPAYSRARGVGTQSVLLSFLRHADDFDVTASVAMRVEAVEALVQLHDDGPTRADRAGTYTLGAELGNISGKGQTRWTVANAADARTAAESIAQAVEIFGAPFLAEFSTLDDVLTRLRRNDKEGWLVSPIHGSRCKRAMAIARLTGHPEGARIARACLDFLASRNDPALRSTERLARALGFVSGNGGGGP